jgi:threonyl-tRNA synthetase
VAFDSEAELEGYLARQAEAMKRDHRKLGKELDIFSIHEEIGPGLVCWHPIGISTAIISIHQLKSRGRNIY